MKRNDKGQYEQKERDGLLVLITGDGLVRIVQRQREGRNSVIDLTPREALDVREAIRALLRDMETQ